MNYKECKTYKEEIASTLKSIENYKLLLTEIDKKWQRIEDILPSDFFFFLSELDYCAALNIGFEKEKFIIEIDNSYQSWSYYFTHIPISIVIKQIYSLVIKLNYSDLHVMFNRYDEHGFAYCKPVFIKLMDFIFNIEKNTNYSIKFDVYIGNNRDDVIDKEWREYPWFNKYFKKGVTEWNNLD